MLKRLLPLYLRKGLTPGLLTKLPKFNFCAEFTVDPFIQHYAEVKMRQHRRLFLNKVVLNQNKDVIYAELRKPNDGMESLKQKGKCPGVIERPSGNIEQEIDIVMDGKKMKRLSKSISFPMVELYVRVEGKQYRCIFYRKDYHPDGFLQKVYLRQYVPGQPNKLTIPVQVTHSTENPHIQRGNQFDRKIETVDVICYNHQYPKRFYVDCSYASPDRPYRLGDLVNTFPPGLVIDSKLSLNNMILWIDEDNKLSEEQRESQIQEKIQRTKVKKQAKPGQTPGTDANKDKAAGGTTSPPAGKK